jgi:hypothetical protein
MNGIFVHALPYQPKTAIDANLGQLSALLRLHYDCSAMRRMGAPPTTASVCEFKQVQYKQGFNGCF